jgi:hypothetical protein
MPKTKLRDSLLNMLGEFVALNKTPDFKLSTQSNQFLAEAIQDEMEMESSADSLFFSQNSDIKPRHLRTTSTNSGYRHSAAHAKHSLSIIPSAADNSDAYFMNGRRQSLPVRVPTTGFFQRLRRPSSRRQASSDDTNNDVDQQEVEAKRAETRAEARSHRDSHQKRQRMRRSPMISESDETESEEKENNQVYVSYNPPKTESKLVEMEPKFTEIPVGAPPRYSTHLKIR